MKARRFCFVVLVAGALAGACSSSSATPYSYNYPETGPPPAASAYYGGDASDANPVPAATLAPAVAQAHRGGHGNSGNGSPAVLQLPNGFPTDVPVYAPGTITTTQIPTTNHSSCFW